MGKGAWQTIAGAFVKLSARPAPTLMSFSSVCTSLQPLSLVTFSTTVYTPGLVYFTDGFFSVDCVPFPKSQNHCVFAVPGAAPDWSVKCTFSGAQPFRLSVMNEGFGFSKTVMVPVFVALPAGVVMVKLTV